MQKKIINVLALSKVLPIMFVMFAPGVLWQEYQHGTVVARLDLIWTGSSAHKQNSSQ